MITFPIKEGKARGRGQLLIQNPITSMVIIIILDFIFVFVSIIDSLATC